jgi:hypothetical protein
LISSKVGPTTLTAEVITNSLSQRFSTGGTVGTNDFDIPTTYFNTVVAYQNTAGDASNTNGLCTGKLRASDNIVSYVWATDQAGITAFSDTSKIVTNSATKYTW